MGDADVIVIGTGGIGSAATYQLARRGARVIGLDRFPGGHAHGSSHGETRIIRKAYFEHPDYVPLLERAYALWAEAEAEAGETLFRRVGLVESGPPDGVLVAGVRAAARDHALPLDNLTGEETAARWPFRLPDSAEAVFEADAGFLFVERSVCAYLRLAQTHGAELVTGASVTGWRPDGDGFVVETTDRSYRADRLVITAGAWARDLLADLAIPLLVRRKHLHWYACDDPAMTADADCPCFFFQTADGLFYGFPAVEGGGVKVAEHTGGVDIADPLTDDKAVEPDDRARVETFIRACLPTVTTNPVDHAVCYYTVSPDEHFIVDRHPDHPGVVFAAGLSGHGYKFAPVLGEVLADLALAGRTAQPIEFLGLDRPGLAVA
ncbi:N-methyl-L-tryptophan oxidase [Bauldia sp.]|uniref:N-methyl-L-tryptophan oxidase n=1 Tax=Bauldia sp. TaxID=2575872 RepID=UPI003BAD3494